MARTGSFRKLEKVVPLEPQVPYPCESLWGTPECCCQTQLHRCLLHQLLVTVSQQGYTSPLRLESFWSLPCICMAPLIWPDLLSSVPPSPTLSLALFTHPGAQPATGAYLRAVARTQGHHCAKLLLRDPQWESFQQRTMSF